ncbi:MAG TPA: UDP-N-acetylmuramate:L-alanyl-gamma-D-glutamyl-meso-diaminopimelate ligase [Terriglobales bacterium]|nr:UDP-N-acetylmuramate:L-alanyl-gamma-D-glutamyl-meso-diaminopimelate ligase [Terriglobales bacterium]
MNEPVAPGSHIHLIAICGVGMASLAGLLQSRGYRVTGSDQNVYPPMSTYLAGVGIEVLPGFSKENLASRPDLVIIGNAVSRGNPEAEAVLREGIPYISFPQALGKFLIGSRQSLVIAGTHGKTTTTALASWVLACGGLDPGFFVGGVPVNFGSGWNAGSGATVVLEGDEYDSAFFDKGPKFLHYRPHRVILTSIEFDHADIYRNLDHVKEAFRKLMRLIPPDGLVIACWGYPAIQEVVREARCRLISYGNGTGADWQMKNIRVEQGRFSFEACYHGKCEDRVDLGLIGRHNVENALAVYALSRELGVERGKLLAGFASFSGVKRRQEIKGEWRGILVIDDFAHHPTAVQSTLDAVREAYPGRKVWALFEPRSNTSRRNVFEREFARALAVADEIIVAGIHQAEKIPQGERLSVERVVDAINQGRGSEHARVIDGTDDIVAYVVRHAAPGDIILVMSNGGFGNIQDKLSRALA